MLNNKYTTLKERLTCFIAHDWTQVRSRHIHMGVEKYKRCKRGMCDKTEVIYQ